MNLLSFEPLTFLCERCSILVKGMKKMWWDKKEEENPVAGTNVAIENSVFQLDAMGINVRKQFVFPDGAKFAYIGITDKNIYQMIDKYEQYLRADNTGSKINLKYNLGRRGIFYQDNEATLIIGKISTFGMEFPYKMYYKNDKCMTATYYYPKRNYEEIIVTNEKTISKSYSALRRLVKLEETYDNKLHTYSMNPQTNNIECKVESLI